jgi:hypothetical protein
MPKAKTFRTLKWLHTYLSLAVLIYCLWMALSGIALNHPRLLEKFSFSNQVMPANYQYLNWNRMSWRDSAFSRYHDNLLYVGGKEGVWQSLDQGKSFIPLTSGFPTSAYGKDTFSLLLADHDGRETLFAGTRSGLFYLQKEQWLQVAHPILGRKPIIDLLQVKQHLLAFTDSAAFKAEIDGNAPVFTALPLPRTSSASPQTPLFRWLRKVHDGSIFGLPGRLLVDSVGLLLVFLSLSGLLIWYVSHRKKRRAKTVLSGRIFAFNFRWHLRLGIVGALFIAVTALSGAFAHPPLLLTIAKLQVPRSLMPQAIASNPWAEQIQRAAYLKSRERLIIATKQGLFSGPLDGKRDFLRLPDTLPIHGMGAQVFETIGQDKLLIGSFSGLYLWDTTNQIVMQLKAKAQSNTPDWGRPIMATGVAIYKGEPILAVDYESGLKPLRQRATLWPAMPNQLREQGRISLWHALFELHNGRIFEEYIGPFYWFITPAGGLVFSLIVLSGTLLWLKRKLK